MNNFFSIVVDTCNHEKWISKCLDSCLIQEYDNFEIVIVDAKSDDNTFKICEEYRDKTPNIRLYQNDVRLPQVANFIWLSELSKDNSIVVSIDGDDWFKDGNVLSKLNEVYNSDEVWMTYGLYEEYPYRDVSFHYQPYPNDVIESNTFREYKWLGSHLRTFRKELILKIDQTDLKDEDGLWLFTTGDQAIMLPMLEMAHDKSRYISDILYVYNVSDMARDTSLNEQKQIELANYIRSKKKYTKIDTL
jgi:glycosyltransferase involved in cell wall biosynthesis